MATVEASDGVALYAERHPEEAGGDLPIIFSCAYSTTHANWRAQVAPLVAAGHRVALWDYRGHGRSEVPTEPDAYTMAQVISDLGRVLDWFVGDVPCVLAGLSFGGLASLHYSARQLASVHGLVLVATGPGFKNAEAAAKWQARADRSAGFIETKGFEAFVHGKAGPTCIGRDPELPAARAAGQAIIAQDSVAVGLFGRNITGPAPSVIDELAGIGVPALVVVGEDDPGFHQAAEVMAAKLPQARSVRVEGGGHILNIEVADDFNAMLVDFLAAL